MRDREPLEHWLFMVHMDGERLQARRVPDARGASIAALSHALDTPPGGKIDFNRVRGALARSAGAALSDADLAGAQQLFLKLWQHGGSGASYILGDLLDTIALARSPASIPFWQQLLDLSRPRDRSVYQRRMHALAALALLAITRGEALAYAALADALGHSHEQVRALAAFYLLQAYAVPGRPAPEAVAAALTASAAHDRAFAPRFQARMALAALDLPTVMDPPDRAFLLQVKLRGDPATRTIAALPEDTLADLHDAIQDAFGWDADHLYSFYMNGKRYDELYAIGCPELSDDWEAGPFLMMPEDGAAPDDDAPDDDALYTTNAPLGMLGLLPKHTFLYFFDFGDSHEFDVTVLGTAPRDAGSYPRLVESQGAAPRQYYGWDDEDDEDDQYGEDDGDDEGGD